MRASKVMLAVLFGSIFFGLLIGYFAYTSALFPPKQEPFGNYATVTSTSFNGTELAFNVRWNNASALPLKVQVTSTVSTEVDSPQCMAGLSSVTSGQMLFLPFAVSPPSGGLNNVYLSIAAKDLVTGNQFTIMYNLNNITASSSLITPIGPICELPPGTSG
ncbi:MAG: hypothetical protein JRN56_00695 [Nitrososphaerota archaeon]|nr:hypothetical protein [Nitrososphaerota archaeon]MDG6903862.1 hypothetical protein [Nitrososphaerota archaeon]MDG6911506.1 hypothetical protein [Nitrososphaerota archaeon]MDG6940408.1 hypothetical protein [Nitrososphaerota archaeon]MDG6960722.1 hypothetical protein [Nitrososphaerota archaeon]